MGNWCVSCGVPRNNSHYRSEVPQSNIATLRQTSFFEYINNRIRENSIKANALYEKVNGLIRDWIEQGNPRRPVYLLISRDDYVLFSRFCGWSEGHYKFRDLIVLTREIAQEPELR